MRRLGVMGAMLALGGVVAVSPAAGPSALDELKSRIPVERRPRPRLPVMPPAPEAPVQSKGNVPGSVRRRLARQAKAAAST